MTVVSREAIDAALATVQDPEIRRPITELKMIKAVDIGEFGAIRVDIWLTISGCPMRDEITGRVTDAVNTVPGVTAVDVVLDVMGEGQRTELREQLQGQNEGNVFNSPGNTTQIVAVASGKGGVGKSSLTANLAVALANRGMSVGLVDADIYGHSIPRMLGVIEAPTIVDGMILPPECFGVRVISMLPFKPGGITQVVAFRGPMLHRALDQFLTDVYWGDLDVLLLDLPPGTGDVAMSVGELLPRAELVVVTTPQLAAAEVSIRAGVLAQQTHQRVIGVIENMAGFPCPHCGQPIDIFGVGGGSLVAETLTRELGTQVPLLGRVPFDTRLRESNDAGVPLVTSDPDSVAAKAIDSIAATLASKPRGLAGMSLGITPAARK